MTDTPPDTPTPIEASIDQINKIASKRRWRIPWPRKKEEGEKSLDDVVKKFSGVERATPRQQSLFDAYEVLGRAVAYSLWNFYEEPHTEPSTPAPIMTNGPFFWPWNAPERSPSGTPSVYPTAPEKFINSPLYRAKLELPLAV